MWTIYEHPLDHPDFFVVREFTITPEGPIPSPFAALSPTLEHARASIPRGCFCIDRAENDDSVIVETWV